MIAFDLYKEYFNDVYIFNSHQDGDIMTNFVCQALPTAYNICKELNGQTNAFKSKHVSPSLDGSKLYAKAKQRSVPMTRKMISKLNDFRLSNNTEYQKFQSCLSSESKKRLLDRSLELEKQVALVSENVRLFLEPSRSDDHITNFESAATKGKYCEIDASRVLDYPNSTLMRTIS
eukprot:CAMPEP_0194365014 /NCGR_PEP_ID=MMETSP0174-20130528/12984_1 /TAXON_ID=216777 /ORGANISM="Proboscia alata, Strain PI-D3" /LENGTH=174 /DNA_ID=CAMNT_0039139405 /DNA_START=110 /DNA_END=634 /DNA_ORIENTATION=-